MIDAGADLVVGGHPHVTQGVEYYQGKLIVYSLGNFVFDGFDYAAGRSGWLLRLTLDKQWPAGLGYGGCADRRRRHSAPACRQPAPCGRARRPAHPRLPVRSVPENVSWPDCATGWTARP
jgi:hypothetical protein